MSDSVGITLEDLVAREEIADVVKRYARGIDRIDSGMLASCYHDGATDDHGTYFSGPADEFVRLVMSTLPRRASTMHFMGAPFIRLEGAVAKCDTYCIAHHISRPDGNGQVSDMILGLRYVDRFERRQGIWRIAKRLVLHDWGYTLRVDQPLEVREMLEASDSARDRTDPSYVGI
jgi:hypothetical protein